MKPSARKNLPSTVILTVGFALIFTAGPALARGSNSKQAVFSAVIMGIAVIVSALVRASGHDDSNGKS